jgi:hypothetical protein
MYVKFIDCDVARFFYLEGKNYVTPSCNDLIANASWELLGRQTIIGEDLDPKILRSAR